MNFLGQIFAFILMTTSIYVTDVDSHADLDSDISIQNRESKSFTTFGILGVCLIVSLTLSCYVKEDLRRLNYKAADES